MPKGMIRSVFWSFLFGYVMICSFVLAMPSVSDAAKQGGNVFFWLMGGLAVPAGLKAILYIGIVISNYLCALAGMTSLSRMAGQLQLAARLGLLTPLRAGQRVARRRMIVGL